MGTITTTYNTISSTNLQPGKPSTSEIALAMNENPTAISQGASGAPRVMLGSFERLDVGSVIRVRFDTTVSTTSATYVTAQRFDFMQGGTARIYHEYASSSGTSDFRVVRYRASGSSVIWSDTRSAASFATITNDIAILPGDYIAVEYQSTGTAQVRNARLYTDVADYIPCGTAFGYVENNTALT